MLPQNKCGVPLLGRTRIGGQRDAACCVATVAQAEDKRKHESWCGLPRRRRTSLARAKMLSLLDKLVYSVRKCVRGSFHTSGPRASPFGLLETADLVDGLRRCSKVVPSSQEAQDSTKKEA